MQQGPSLIGREAATAGHLIQIYGVAAVRGLRRAERGEHLFMLLGVAGPAPAGERRYLRPRVAPALPFGGRFPLRLPLLLALVPMGHFLLVRHVPGQVARLLRRARRHLLRAGRRAFPAGLPGRRPPLLLVAFDLLPAMPYLLPRTAHTKLRRR